MPSFSVFSSILVAAVLMFLAALSPANAEMREAVLLSLPTPPTQNERDALAASGLVLGTHLGRGRFLASVEQDQRASTTAKIGLVRSDALISDLPLSIKLEPVLGNKDPSLLREGDVSNNVIEVIVTPAVGLADEEVLSVLTVFDASAAKALRSEGWLMSVTGAQLFDLAMQPGIAQIETESAFPIIK